MAFVLTLTGAHRLRLRRMHAQMNARLDERVLERTRIARDLHDTLLQSLQALLQFPFGHLPAAESSGRGAGRP